MHHEEGSPTSFPVTGRAQQARMMERVVGVPAGGTAMSPADSLARRVLERVRVQAAADRAAAADDRAQAVADREAAAQARRNAALDRARAAADLAAIKAIQAVAEAHLARAHLDDLTGAYRRDMGRLALSHEIDRARRRDGSFVVVFVDVDDVKTTDDEAGLAADRALQAVVATVRAKLRSFDPILRFGGDAFVAGIGGTDLVGAQRRFGAIREDLRRTSAIEISVGFAALGPGDTVDELIDRADRDLYRRRAEDRVQREARVERRGRGFDRST